MNLHGIVSGAIGMVNPQIIGAVFSSDGYTTNADGERVPSYTEFDNVPLQVQSLMYNDLRTMDGLNIQGNRIGIYLNGNWNGIVRAKGKGGDMVIIPSGPSEGAWLVGVVLESWPDWTKLGCTQQMTGPEGTGAPALIFDQAGNSGMRLLGWL